MEKVELSSNAERTRQTCVVTPDIDMLAPDWLNRMITNHRVRLIYRIIDGHSVLKGVKIDDEMARIGDKIHFDGKWISVERR